MAGFVRNVIIRDPMWLTVSGTTNLQIYRGPGRMKKYLKIGQTTCVWYCLLLWALQAIWVTLCRYILMNSINDEISLVENFSLWLTQNETYRYSFRCMRMLKRSGHFLIWSKWFKNTALYIFIQPFWHRPSCSSSRMRKQGFLDIFVAEHQEKLKQESSQ